MARSLAPRIQVTIAPDYYPEVIGEAGSRVEALTILGEWFLANSDAALMYPALRCATCQHSLTHALDACPCMTVVDGELATPGAGRAIEDGTPAADTQSLR